MSGDKTGNSTFDHSVFLIFILIHFLCSCSVVSRQGPPWRSDASRCGLWFPWIQTPVVCFPFISRATPQETTVKPCWFSVEGKIKPLASVTTKTRPLTESNQVWFNTTPTPQPNEATPCMTTFQHHEPAFCFQIYRPCLAIRCVSFLLCQM